MRIPIAVFFLASAGLLSPAESKAQQPTSRRSTEPAVPAASMPGSVDRAIAQFEREGLGLVRSFLRAGRASAPLLRKILGRDDLTDRVRDFADRALVLCESSGEAQSGLRFGLSATVDSLRVGESLKLVATLCNVSEQPIDVPAGMSYAGNRFGNGSLLHLVGQDGEPAVQAGFSVGFCGTGAVPLVERLDSLSYSRFEIKVKFDQTVDGRVGYRQHDGRYLNLGMTHLLLPKTLKESGVATPGKHGGHVVRLRMRCEIAPPREGGSRAWHGVLTSREVALELLPEER